MGWGSGSRICLRRRRGGVRGGYRRHEQRCCRPVATARTSFEIETARRRGRGTGRTERADGVKRKESQRLASRRVRAEIDADCAGRVRSSRHRATPGAQPRPYVFSFAPSVLTGLTIATFTHPAIPSYSCGNVYSFAFHRAPSGQFHNIACAYKHRVTKTRVRTDRRRRERASPATAQPLRFKIYKDNGRGG